MRRRAASRPSTTRVTGWGCPARSSNGATGCGRCRIGTTRCWPERWTSRRPTTPTSARSSGTGMGRSRCGCRAATGRWSPAVRLMFAPDLGVVAGVAETGTWYGFRQDPYKSQLSFGVSYATAAQRFRATVSSDFRDVVWGLDAGLELRASGVEIVRFYGFGNEIAAPRSDDYYKVHQEQYLIAPSLVARSGASRFSIGPLLKYAHTTLDSGTFVAVSPPYGARDFLQVGAQAELRVDARDRARAPSKGALVALGGSWYPAAYDVVAPFGEGHAEAAAYLTAAIPLQPTLALRVAGMKVWGRYPFHQAAYIGGATTVRGFSEHRFAGDAAVYGNAELRLACVRLFALLPEELGGFGLADVGRVYLGGGASDRWHARVGGGGA